MQRYEVLTADELGKVHENILKIMANIGVVMPDEASKGILKAHGCTVDGDTVKFPRSLVEKCIKSAPSSFTINSRDGAHDVLISIDTLTFLGPNCPPYVVDLDRGHRNATLADFIDAIKICDNLENIDMHAQTPCEPNDVPQAERAVAMTYNTMKYSTKPFMGSSMGYKNAMHTIEMAAIPFGGLEAVKNKPVLSSIPCTLTPLVYDPSQLEAIRAYAEWGQVQVVNSLPIAGLSAPVTLAGMVSVEVAEVLAGIVLAQCINPGTPCVLSGAGAASNMANGSIAIGAPEHALNSLIISQLAHLYEIPCRVGGSLTDSKAIDAQAGYESAMDIMANLMGCGNYVLHAAGIIEGYNATSFEKLVLDNEFIGYVKRIMAGVGVSEEDLAYDVIEEVAPGGTYLVEDHTLENFRDEIYVPSISNRETQTAWKANGSLTVEQVANKKWKQILEEHPDPVISDELDKELQAYIAKVEY
ncbi:MAG: trimethylamine methyltransferase family protein [Eggerthellaceae bacterium]|nr:trimethylamine methyltransferase family protein [Eggerthellaceae bacterium]